jgi:arabinofuranosyltransferase
VQDRRADAVLVAASLGLSGAFISRSAFDVDGRTYFSLFDDAMISMRYARNLVDGFGLVWNPHEQPVEGYTNLLWTLWMALLHAVAIPEATISLAVMISGALLLAGNVLLIRSIACLLAPGRLAPFLAAAVTAVYYPLVYWTLRGMEVGLLALLVSAGVLLALRLGRAESRRDIALLCVVVAAAVLTRMDAVVLMLPVVGYAALSLRRRAAPLAASLVLPVVGQTVFREAYYHALLPNTYYLKVEGVPLSDRLGRGGWAFLALQVSHLWMPTAIAGAYLLRCCRHHREPWLLVAVLGGACLYSVYVGGDAWEWMLYSNRYVAPAIPLLLVLAAIGVIRLVRAQPALVALVLLAAGGVALATIPALPSGRAASLAGLGHVHAGALDVFVAAIAALVLLPARILRRSGVMRRVTLPLAATILVVAVVDGPPVASWIRDNGQHLDTDAAMTRFGLALRADTKPGARVAVVWAGAIPYFAHRPAVDLLGKSDRTVAHLESHLPFYPGHAKWDYSYSVGDLRPDVVAQLWRPSSADLAAFRAWGYRRLGSGFYVRRGDDAVAAAALVKKLTLRVPTLSSDSD